MKNLNKYLLFIASVIILWLLFYFPNRIMQLELTQKQMSDYVEEIQIKTNVLERNFETENKMTGLKATNVFCLEFHKDSFQLSFFVHDSPLLVLRYSDINCSSCYESALKELEEAFGDALQSVVILCSYMRDHDFMILKRVNQIKFPIYKIPSDAFGWPVEEKNTPYFFVLHPDMKISNIYIPDKAFPEMNKAYLESVKRLLAE